MINKKCIVCKKNYKVNSYRDKITKYCSRKCKGKMMSKMLKGRPSKIKGRHWKCKLSEEAKRKKRIWFGEKSWNWKGGKRLINEYVYIYKPNYYPFHRATKYIAEHRFVMESKLKRFLTTNEIVHHINGIKNDNRPENLRLVVLGKNWHPCLCPKCGFDFDIK
jgi:hypothetical protein